MSHHHVPGTHEDSSHGSLKVAFYLNLGFKLIEIVGGLLTNSVAILSDAVHDLGDSCRLASHGTSTNYPNKAQLARAVMATAVIPYWED